MTDTVSSKSDRIAAYRERLKTMTNERLAQEAGMRIHDAAIMSGRRSNDGWCDDQCDACYDEAEARGNLDLYQRGYNSAVRSQGHTDMVTDIITPLEVGEPDGVTEKAL
jgi:hypothetical protein